MVFYRKKKGDKAVKNSYADFIKELNYTDLLTELNKTNDRLLKDRVAWTKAPNKKLDRVKGNTFKLDKWKKVQLLNLIQKKYNRRF